MKMILVFELQHLNLTIGNLYHCELTPKVYDPHTLQECEKSYIVKCDDNKFRKVEARYFMPLRDYNLQNLNII